MDPSYAVADNLWIFIIPFSVLLMAMGHILFEWLETIFYAKAQSPRKTKFWFSRYKMTSRLMYIPGVNVIIFLAYIIIIKKT